MFRFATHRKRRPWPVPVLLAFLFAGMAAAAGNTSAPITINADTATISRADDVSTYTGHVVLQRGGITLTGAKLVVEQLPDGGLRAVLTGHPATLERISSASEAGPVTGHASRIIYVSADAQVVLRGDAVVKRSGNVIRSGIIRHDLDTGRTVAEGVPEGDGRVTITLQPGSTDPQP